MELELKKNILWYKDISKVDTLSSRHFSEFMDNNDALGHFRKHFIFPTIRDIAHDVVESDDSINPEGDSIYFCGNSLGLQSVESQAMVLKGLETWGRIGVDGWFRALPGEVEWTEMEKFGTSRTNMTNPMADIVGAKPSEVAVSAALTQNLNNLLLSFYKPTNTRYKILMEDRSFPSDRYAVEAILKFHGYDPAESLLLAKPMEGEHCLRTETILDIIAREGQTIAIILFPGIHYYTGQLFSIKEITAAGHAQGCFVGWDLAHAVGNVSLELHDWNVDFAAWCTYKYLNSGPGGIGGLFLHERHEHRTSESNQLGGWWAVDTKQRFTMNHNLYTPRAGASGFQQSSMNILSLSSLVGSLELFSQTSMVTLREKSLLLTGYLEELLLSEISSTDMRIITPSDPEQRGCQLSIEFSLDVIDHIHKGLRNHGVVCDKRNPNVIRVAPVPMYSTYEDVRQFVHILKKLLMSTPSN